MSVKEVPALTEKVRRPFVALLLVTLSIQFALLTLFGYLDQGVVANTAEFSVK